MALWISVMIAACIPCSARTVEEGIAICQCDVEAVKACRAACDPAKRAECERACVINHCE